MLWWVLRWEDDIVLMGQPFNGPFIKHWLHERVKFWINTISTNKITMIMIHDSSSAFNLLFISHISYLKLLTRANTAPMQGCITGYSNPHQCQVIPQHWQHPGQSCQTAHLGAELAKQFLMSNTQRSTLHWTLEMALSTWCHLPGCSLHHHHGLAQERWYHHWWWWK